MCEPKKEGGQRNLCATSTIRHSAHSVAKSKAHERFTRAPSARKVCDNRTILILRPHVSDGCPNRCSEFGNICHRDCLERPREPFCYGFCRHGLLSTSF